MSDPQSFCVSTCCTFIVRARGVIWKCSKDLEINVWRSAEGGKTDILVWFGRGWNLFGFWSNLGYGNPAWSGVKEAGGVYYSQTSPINLLFLFLTDTAATFFAYNSCTLQSKHALLTFLSFFNNACLSISTPTYCYLPSHVPRISRSNNQFSMCSGYTRNGPNVTNSTRSLVQCGKPRLNASR